MPYFYLNMQNEEISKIIQDMVQMPVHSNRDWKILTNIKGLQSFRHAMLDFTEEKRFDEDLAKCMLRWTLKQGGVLKIRKDQGDTIAQIDQMVIKGHMHNEFIMRLIKVLIKELEDRVYEKTEDNVWYSGLPGVTKIKIKWHWSDMRYTLNHKMGKDGGKNYHLTGHFNGLNKPKDNG